MCVYRKEYNTFVVVLFFKCVEASHRVSKYCMCVVYFYLCWAPWPFYFLMKYYQSLAGVYKVNKYISIICIYRMYT